MLFGNPERFTRSIIIIFGIIMLIMGIGNLIQSRRTGEGDAPDKSLMAAATAELVIGAILTFGNKLVYGIFPVIAVIYGVFLIIVGIHKTRVYLWLKKEGFRPSILSIISALAAIALGVVIVLNPFETVETLWKFAGISLVAEAVLDLVAFFLGMKQE